MCLMLYVATAHGLPLESTQDLRISDDREADLRSVRALVALPERLLFNERFMHVVHR